MTAEGQPSSPPPAPETPAPGGRIIVVPDGPLLVEGACVVTDRAGNRFPPRAGKSSSKVALCRCGHSAVKPWCDGSHKRVGFSAPETAAPASAAPDAPPPANPPAA